jgi:hypothetical protein
MTHVHWPHVQWWRLFERYKLDKLQKKSITFP